MLPEDVPAVLRDRLGAGGTAALLDLVDREIDERSPEMITAATERFERRLVEEIAGMRVLVAGTEGTLRQEIAASEGRIRQDIAAGRVELFKWSFFFWIGQVLALAGFFAVMIRMVRA